MTLLLLPATSAAWLADSILVGSLAGLAALLLLLMTRLLC